MENGIQCPRCGHDDEWVGLICDFCGTCAICGDFSAAVVAITTHKVRPCQCLANSSSIARAIASHEPLIRVVEALIATPALNLDDLEELDRETLAKARQTLALARGESL